MTAGLYAISRLPSSILYMQHHHAAVMVLAAFGYSTHLPSGRLTSGTGAPGRLLDRAVSLGILAASTALGKDGNQFSGFRTRFIINRLYDCRKQKAARRAGSADNLVEG